MENTQILPHKKKIAICCVFLIVFLFTYGILRAYGLGVSDSKWRESQIGTMAGHSNKSVSQTGLPR